MKKEGKMRISTKSQNIITEKAKTIYPLYTSYRGYKIAIPYLSNINVACPIKLIMDKEFSFTLTVLKPFQTRLKTV